MHRHHPYGGSGYEERRRSASPGGRFPRSDRGGPGRGGYGRGGGASRGRGRGSSGPSYPPPPPPQYGGYDSGPAYDSYGHPPYESRYGGGGGGGGNGGYGYNGPPPPPVHDSYGRDDGYDSYGPSYGPPYEQDAWREDDRGPPPPRRRRDRDERQREALIEDRINRERPCRTLFIRNIKYESDSAALRRQFEEHGMIRTFFDLISSRGMLFVTYYDIRAAQAARDRLQGLEVNGRPIDVHYSLPRPEETEGRVDRDKHQGTLLVTLRNSRMPIDDNELEHKFSQYGDIKMIRPADGRPDQRLVEMFDTRATEQIYDSLSQQPLQDGIMDLDWAWDVLGEPVTDVVLPPPRYQDDGPRDRPSRGAPRGRGGPPRGGPRDRSDDYGPPPRDYDDDRYGPGPQRGGRGMPRGSGSHMNGDRGYNSPRRDYGRNDPPLFGVNPPPSAAPPQPSEQDRLEQARKVQQLLAALKNPADVHSGQSQPPPVPAVPPPSAAAPRPPFPPPPNGAPFPPPAWSPNAIPPPPSSFPPAAAATVPPAVLALLQQSAQQQTSGSAGPFPPPPLGAPPTPSSAGASGSNPSTPVVPTVQNPQAMQHLLALLAAQQKK